MQRLLVVACSQRKREDPGPLPAIECYDGGAFRVIRKLKREGKWPDGLTLLILSAKYGLIEGERHITPYDLRMTTARAADLSGNTEKQLVKVVKAQGIGEIYFALGKDYLPAIGETASKLSQVDIQIAEGRIGQRLSELKSWITQIE